MKFSFNQYPAHRNLLGSTILFGAVAIAFTPNTASAQDPAGDTIVLAPIIVTGSGQTISEDNDTIVPKRSVSALKTDTPLVETPRSVSVVTRKEMEQRGATDMIQATRYSSGINNGSFGFDPRFDQIVIRGIETTISGDFRDGLRQPVMTYGTFPTEVYTLDRIEVLKGPASVMYGAASAAGIVNKISKLPQKEAHNEVELQYGTVGRKQAAFDIGGPVGESGDMYYRIVGLTRQGETSYDIQDDRYLLQPSFTWEPTDSTKLTVYGLAQKSEGESSAWTFKDGGRIKRVSDPDYDHQKVRQYQFGYQLEHDFGNGLTFRQNARVSDLDLKARYVDRTTLYPLVPGGLADRWSTAAVTDDIRAYQIDNQIKAEFDAGGISHTILAGLDYTGVNSDFASGYGLTLPGDIGSAPSPALTGFTSNDLRQTGLYAQEQAEFGNWRFVGGLRYDWLDQETADKVAGIGADKSEGALSGQVGLLYLFDNGLAPYVSYGTSFVPSTERSAGLAVLDPTKGRQIEAGIKYQPEEENFSLSTSVYRLVETGKPQYAGAVGPVYVYENSGENTYTGFEIEGRTAFDNGISLIAAYTYTDAEITGNLDGSIIGNTPTTTPRHVASLWVNYAAPEDTAIGGLSIGGGIRATSESFTSDANTDKNGGAVYLDASLSYDFGAKSPDLKGLSLAVSATNLADREEQVCNGGYCYFGQGRTVLGSLKYKW